MSVFGVVMLILMLLLPLGVGGSCLNGVARVSVAVLPAAAAIDEPSEVQLLMVAEWVLYVTSMDSAGETMK
jgi:hypothetical protein